MEKNCTSHCFYKNRHGELQCINCGFRIIKRVERRKKFGEIDITVSV